MADTSKKKVSLISLGCSKNLVDSEFLIGGLKNERFSIVDSPEDSNIVIVNTCGFLDKAREDGNKIIKNDNATITYGGIVTGALGTRVVADWLGVELEDSVQYDMIDRWKNKTIHK